MKILLSAYACEPNKGSEPGVGWNWALALVRRGHQVWVITRKNNQASIELELARLGEPYTSNLHFLYYDTPNWILRLKKMGLGVQLYYALWQRGILQVARDAHATHQFDVTQHLTFGVWRQPTQMYKLGIPCIFGPVGGGESSPWGLVRGMPSFKARASEYLRFAVNGLSLLNPALRKCLKQSAVIVSKTPETAAWVAKLGIKSLVSLEIGIAPERISKNSLVPIKGKVRCLYAGRLISMKGIHLALMAIAQVQQKGIDATFTIVGNGPLLEHFQAQSSALGIADKVTFTGQLNQADLFAKYREHDVLLFPSLHDSSGNVVLESFAQSLPVLCLNLGGPGVMVDDTCGRAIEVRDVMQEVTVKRLADALTDFASSPELMQQFRVGAKAKAIASSWDATVERVYMPIEQAFTNNNA
ncbi:glycosyltransferase family 4 protein [Methylotenera sp.]|uniref:glycosyltransferase family 4 protein n=1 Tax=Methylotenera sp. TaxID=2051956 RepID=UPI002718DDBC|nr:glycosyltransferase family 4 protein [Methylotenera sp.]MDO9205530.1 glycosyltransferase family 4 protein [Methylotenera sp.]